MLSQPRDPVDVEMVGRLVERQQLRVVQQRPGEHQAAPLAAGERLHTRLHPVGETPERDPAEQAVEHRAKPRLARPLVLGPIADQLGTDGAIRGQIIALTDERDRHAGGPRDRAGVGLFGADDHPQQRRFAGAVGADDPDPLALVDAERQLVQHVEAGVALGDRVEVDEVADGDRS